MPEFAIRIPKVSMAASEGTVTEHLVADGDRVEEGEPLYLLETDKVEQEVDAPATGVVRWTADLGETLDVGTQIGHIETDE